MFALNCAHTVLYLVRRHSFTRDAQATHVAFFFFAWVTCPGHPDKTRLTQVYSNIRLEGVTQWKQNNAMVMSYTCTYERHYLFISFRQ